MRMSCNGCRVLRKGCTDNCAIRPCLQWIRSPEAQGNATVFLAKFYGRAGLINLITGGPDHLRPALFRSLLYEACGRMLNPVYGSVGLLWSGNWPLCQAAVESVLRGAPISQAPVAANAVPPLRTCDIRHVTKSSNNLVDGVADLHRLADKSRARFKRPGQGAHRLASSESGLELVFAEPAGALPDVRHAEPLNWAHREPSHESASHGGERENDSHVSVDTVQGSHVSQTEPEAGAVGAGGWKAGLDLTLGLLPPVRKAEPENDDSRFDKSEPRFEACTVELGLAISA